MWHARASLMMRSSAAEVVLLPEPVGPVTTTRPSRAADHDSTSGGRPSSGASGASGMTRKMNDGEPRLLITATRKRPVCVW